MTTLEKPPSAPAMPPPSPSSRLAPLARYTTVLRIAGGLLTLVGALLPWATFVLNEGPYPEKSTLEFFSAPFAVTGFRLHLAVFGIAAIVIALVAVPGRERILRAVGWGVIAIAVVNGLYIAVEGGGLGAITAADGVAFGAIVALIGGVLLVLGAIAGGLTPVPVWKWRFNRYLEWLILVVTYALLLLLVSAVLTSGGQGSAANVYAGAVFLSFLGAVGGLLGALHASGLLAWIGCAVRATPPVQRDRAARRRAAPSPDRGGQRVLDDRGGEHRRLRGHRHRAEHRGRPGRPAGPGLRRVPRYRRVRRGELLGRCRVADRDPRCRSRS